MAAMMNILLSSQPAIEERRLTGISREQQAKGFQNLAQSSLQQDNQVEDIPLAKNLATSFLARDDIEGFSPTPKEDHLGNLSVGIGANIDDPAIAPFISDDVRSGKREIGKQEALDIVTVMMDKIAEPNARQFVGSKNFDNLSTNSKALLLNLGFNMSPESLSSFKEFKKAIIANDIEGMKRELKDSKRFKEDGLDQRTLKEIEFFINSEEKK